MSSAARAYEQFGYERAYQPSRPRVRVTTNPQFAARPAAQPSGVSALTVALVAGALIVVAAIFAFVHVWLDAESITLSVQSEAVSSELATIRHEGSLLEVEVGTLANPSRVQSGAQDMGMISPEDATIIYLSADVVATDASGNLSLAQTAKVLSGSAGA